MRTPLGFLTRCFSLSASVAFYEDGLRFPKMPDVAFFTLDGSWLGIYGREALAEDAQISSEGSGFGGFTLAHNVSSESEVDDVLAQAAKAGGTIVKMGQRVFWGGCSGPFRDLDGHLWEVAHNPLFWVGPKDEDAEQDSGGNGG